MNKKDGILIFILLLIAGLAYMVCRGIWKEKGNQVVILLDGFQYGIYDLDKNQKIEVKGRNGYNIIEIQDGEAFVWDADCPDRYCAKQGKVSSAGESLICLPHKLVVEVSVSEAASEMDDFDIIVK